MLRSPVVRLTLLPMLATAAVAAADPPGVTAPALSPPGLTPTIDELSCDDDPSWQLRTDCADELDDVLVYDGVAIRGGFGTYFYGGGGG